MSVIGLALSLSKGDHTPQPPKESLCQATGGIHLLVEPGFRRNDAVFILVMENWIVWTLRKAFSIPHRIPYGTQSNTFSEFFGQPDNNELK